MTNYKITFNSGKYITLKKVTKYYTAMDTFKDANKNAFTAMGHIFEFGKGKNKVHYTMNAVRSVTQV